MQSQRGLQDGRVASEFVTYCLMSTPEWNPDECKPLDLILPVTQVVMGGNHFDSKSGSNSDTFANAN